MSRNLPDKGGDKGISLEIENIENILCVLNIVRDPVEYFDDFNKTTEVKVLLKSKRHWT